MANELDDVPDLLRTKKYAEAVAIVTTAKADKHSLEALDRAIAMVLPHAGVAATKLYARVKRSPYPYVHHLLAAYQPSHAARFVDLAPMGAPMVPPEHATKALAERARLDPHGHLDALLGNAAVMDALFPPYRAVQNRYPGPRRRAKPLSTDLAALWGRPPPAALAAWLAVLDHWDFGYYPFGVWAAWNDTPSELTWNPPPLPPAKVNAIEWALKLQGALDPWDERATDGTLNLLFAGCQPFGRVRNRRAELGVFMGTPPEVLEIDRAHDLRRVVAADLDTFVGLAPRVKQDFDRSGPTWKPAPVEAKSRAVHMATRAGWIVDLLLDLPRLPAIVASFKKHAASELGALDEPGDALYWLFHAYFTDDKPALAHVLKQAEASEAKLVRDAAAFVKKDKLAKKRAAFLAKLGKRPSTSVTSRGHAIDKPALLKAAKQLAPLYKTFPDKPTVDPIIKAMPDDLESWFAGLDEASAGGSTFAAMLAAARDLRGAPTTVKRDVELDDDEPGIAVYYGDLTIGRDLRFGRSVVVLGDLSVAGTIEDASEYLNLWVTGSVKARFVHCQHKAWIGGKLVAELALIGRRGTLTALGGITAKLALRDSDEGKGFRGKLTAKHSIDTCGKDADAQVAKLRALLLPAAFAELEPGLFDSEKLIALAEKGKRFLR
jgi:hypothetical protein